MVAHTIVDAVDLIRTFSQAALPVLRSMGGFVHRAGELLEALGMFFFQR
jgi:hypothetical protein